MATIIAIVTGIIILVICLAALSNKFSFECKHKNLTAIQEDGRQYCTICNKAFVPPCPHVWELFGRNKQKCAKCGELREIPAAACQHTWKKVDVKTITNAYGNTTSMIDILECSNCGDRKKFSISVHDD